MWFKHLRAALIQTYNLKSLNLKLSGSLHYYSLCTYLVILPYGPEAGRKCHDTHCGLEVFGEPVVLAGQRAKRYLKIIRFSLFSQPVSQPLASLFSKFQAQTDTSWIEPQVQINLTPMAKDQLPNPHLLWSSYSWPTETRGKQILHSQVTQDLNIPNHLINLEKE